MTRIAIAGFQHETNTFATTTATYRDFEIADSWPRLLRGAELIPGTREINLPIAGFTKAAQAQGIDLVPLLWCFAEPSAHVTDDAFERIIGEMLAALQAAGPVDAVYLDLHGAMVTETHEDGEGEILRRVRGVIGPNLPLVASLDLHANISPEMARLASALTIFRTYPHLDMDETGTRAFALTRHLLRGKPLAGAFRQVPYLIPLSAQYTGADPARSLYAALDVYKLAAGLSADIALGFTAADVPDAGPSIVAYGPDRATAEALAEAILQDFLESEPYFDKSLWSPKNAVATAMAETGGKPVVLADVQDNPGAGASSDATGLLRALLDGEAQGAVLALLADPEVAAQAHAAGLGAEIEAALGGKAGTPGDCPYHGRFRVEALSDGHFPFTGEMYRGAVAEIGPCAVLRVLETPADLRVIVSTLRSQCLDQAIFTHIGLDPAEQRILALKSTVHYRADFEPIASRILSVEAPGFNLCRVDKIPYTRLRPDVRRG